MRDNASLHLSNRSAVSAGGGGGTAGVRRAIAHEHVTCADDRMEKVRLSSEAAPSSRRVGVSATLPGSARPARAV